MGPKLINVRLDEERVLKAQMLRERGVALSDLVREAIDQRFAAVAGSGAPRDVRAIIDDIFAQHPDPPSLPPRRYSVHDRHAARRAIVRKLRRPRR